MSIWILLAILAGLGSSLMNFIVRYILRDADGDAAAFAWLLEAARLVCFIAVVLVLGDFTFDPRGLPLFLALGIVEVGAVYFTFKMHSHSHLSISTIISRTRLIWVPIIAFILLGEALTSIEYAGILVLFVGLSIAASPSKIMADRGIKYAYLAAIVVALYSVLMKLATPFASTAVILIFVSIPSVIILPVLMKDARPRLKAVLTTRARLRLISVGLSPLYVYLFAKAVSLGPASKVAAVYQGMMIFSVLAGIIFLNERENIAKKIAGTLISLIGVMLLTLR